MLSDKGTGPALLKTSVFLCVLCVSARNSSGRRDAEYAEEDSNNEYPFTEGAIPMSQPVLTPSRRTFLSALTLSAAAFTTRGLFAEELALARTPRMTEGPFYPPKLPLDTDNDLLIVNDSITPAVGEITHLTGRVLSASGEPIRNA